VLWISPSILSMRTGCIHGCAPRRKVRRWPHSGRSTASLRQAFRDLNGHDGKMHGHMRRSSKIITSSGSCSHFANNTEASGSEEGLAVDDAEATAIGKGVTRRGIRLFLTVL
jgi:hypothetical protein